MHWSQPGFLSFYMLKIMICKLTICKLFFSKLTKESCSSPYPPPHEKGSERTQIKEPFTKICKSQALVSCFYWQKSSNYPLLPLYLVLCWLLFTGNPVGFSTNRVGRREFCGGEGREEEGTWLGSNQNIHKGELHLQTEAPLLRKGF